MTMKNETLGAFALDIHSKIISELDYVIGFRLIQGNNPTDATVETADLNDTIFNDNFDAKFGERTNPNNPHDPLEASRILEKGHLEPVRPLETTIFPDVLPELDECYTINILIIDRYHEKFMCNDNEDDSEDFFCDHTVCIVNNDG